MERPDLIATAWRSMRDSTWSSGALRPGPPITIRPGLPGAIRPGPSDHDPTWSPGRDSAGSSRRDTARRQPPSPRPGPREAFAASTGPRVRRRSGWRGKLPAVLLVAAIVGGVGVGYLDRFDAAGSTARTTAEETEAALTGSPRSESLQSMTPRLSSVVNPAAATTGAGPDAGQRQPRNRDGSLAAAPPGPDQSTADVQVLRYIVEVEQDEVAIDRAAFAALVNATLNDHAAGRRRDVGSSRSRRNPSTSG